MKKSTYLVNIAFTKSLDPQLKEFKVKARDEAEALQITMKKHGKSVSAWLSSRYCAVKVYRPFWER